MLLSLQQQLGMAKLPMLRARLLLLLLFLTHFVLQLQCSNGLQSEPKHVYIIYLGEREHEDVDLVTASHHDLLASIVGSKEEALESIIYSYRHGFSGFSALLTKSQSRKIAALPGVVSVTKSRFYRTHTTRSWDFLGLEYNQPNGLLTKAKNGEGIIVGVIDSGIWPESLSFSGDAYGPPPPKWKGICQAGALFGPNNCNRKLIGARWYAEDVEQSVLDGEYLSPRDANGHGTHTASTAAGNLVYNVSFHGLAPGVARGGAPRARLAVYKVCWGAYPTHAGCSGAGIMKAIDDAIHDGVDVLSLSIGGPSDFPGTLHAVANGITVVFSAGNDGPVTQTVENVSPWLLTVAATTVDRLFPTVITLGNNQRLVGQSLFVATEGTDHFYEVLGYDAVETCDPAYINSTDVKGKIIFCIIPSKLSPPPKLVDIALILLKNGGKGFIFSQYNMDTLDQWQFTSRKIPFIAVDLEIANQMLHYLMTATDTPKAKISLTETTIGSGVPAPKVAAFSSRGPSPIYPGVLKPDIAAPGVTILAAAPQIAVYKALGVHYRFDSGTSMSCPHVSGIVALLKSVHPDWSPAALKSALMTTAVSTDNNGLPIQADGTPVKIADPFDYGAGFVNPSKADDPGLIYDIDASDYLRFFHCVGGLGVNGNCTTPKESVADLNLPSIAIPNLKASETVMRTVTNVGQPDAVYKTVSNSWVTRKSSKTKIHRSSLIKMPRARKTARMSTGGYYPPRALFEPTEPREEDIVVIDEEEDPEEDKFMIVEDMEEDEEEEHQEQVVASPTPTSTSPSPQAPASPPSAAVAEGSPQPLGWYEDHYYKEAEEDTCYHPLLMHILERYYPEFQATVEYHSIEHKHPLMNSYWETKLTVKSWDTGKQARKVESVHTHVVSRDSIEASMEDAAYEAFLYYRGRRIEAMKDDDFKFFPRFDATEDTWVIENPAGSSPTLEAQVKYTHELLLQIEALKIELQKQRLFNQQSREVVDGYRAQLGLPEIHKEIDIPLITTDTAP